ncbi:hypothetical protein [Dyadobacter sp. BHUBP1]|uniref:hypothetical protein n=1 Tax=Dyadobacter sp. BHUBP1 TaxID=3424178 RepID=UPI003D33EAE2
MTKNEVFQELERQFASQEEIDGFTLTTITGVGHSDHFRTFIHGISPEQLYAVSETYKQQAEVRLGRFSGISSLLRDLFDSVINDITRHGSGKDTSEDFATRKVAELLANRGPVSLSELLMKIKTKKQPTQHNEFHKKAQEAREKGMTVDQFVESLLATLPNK